MRSRRSVPTFLKAVARYRSAKTLRPFGAELVTRLCVGSLCFALACLALEARASRTAAKLALPLSQGVTFADKVGNLKLTNANRFRVYTAGQFVGIAREGQKIHLVSKQQQFSADCYKIDGTFSGNQGSGLKIQTATMSGGVHAVLTRLSSVSGRQTSTVDGETAVYTASSNNLKITGGVTLHNVDPAASQAINAVGSDADLTLSPPGTKGQPVQSGVVNGPVKFDMKGTRVETGQSGSPTRTPFTVNGTCDQVKYNGPLYTVTLIGHVHTVGNDPMSGGDVDANIETIHLNPDGTLDYVEWEGSPGTTVVSTRALGGGH